VDKRWIQNSWIIFEERTRNSYNSAWSVKKNDLWSMYQWLDRPCKMRTLRRSGRERNPPIWGDVAGSRSSAHIRMPTLLAMGLLMLVSCKCRICKQEYQSLLVSTARCREAKALARRKTTDSILISGEVRRSIQSRLEQYHHHELDWINLLLELDEFKKNQ
jgi:hypothetical protein